MTNVSSTRKCFINVRDEVFCTISGLSPSHLQELEKKYAVFVDGYFFMPAYKLGRWDGKKKFFEKTGKTYLPFLPDILQYLDDNGYKIELNDLRKPIAPPNTICASDQFGHKGIFLRPYQVDSVNTLAESGNGFIIAGTGAGKSLICSALVDIYGKAFCKTLTVVPSSDLVSQTTEWYLACGLDAGEYSGNRKELDKMHIVATWQSLQNNPQLMSLFQMFIIDEAHGVKGQVIYDLITDHGKHIPFRFGVTGTFPKPIAEQMMLTSTIGEIKKEIPAKWLIDNGYLAKVEIEPIVIEMPSGSDDFPDYSSEKSYLSKNEDRLDVIANILIMKCNQFGNTMALVNSVEMGEKLQKRIANSVFLYGNNDKQERKTQYDSYAEQDGIITIATFGIASTGISIDRIFHLSLIDAGKSFVRAIQSVGRGTRLAKDKNSVHVTDIYSNLKWSKKHFKERKKHYEEAQYPILTTTKVKIKK